MHAWEKCMQTCSLKPGDTPCFRSKLFLLKKLKLSTYRPYTGPQGSRRLRLQDLKHSPHECGKVVSPRTGHLYPPEVFLELIPLIGSVEPRAIVWPEELSQSGIESTTFRFVAQCLNQLRHRVPMRRPIW